MNICVCSLVGTGIGTTTTTITGIGIGMKKFFRSNLFFFRCSGGTPNFDS